MNDFNSFGRVNKIKHVRYVLNVSHSHKKEHFRTVRACVAQTMLRENEKERESEMIDRMEKNFEQLL